MLSKLCRCDIERVKPKASFIRGTNFYAEASQREAAFGSAGFMGVIPLTGYGG